MTKLTGKGRPTMNTPGEVGQYYEDLNTGDIYECRRSSKYSPTHHAPVGGYWWELRAKGEDRNDHGDFYGADDLIVFINAYNSVSTATSAQEIWDRITDANRYANVRFVQRFIMSDPTNPSFTKECFHTHMDSDMFDNPYTGEPIKRKVTIYFGDYAPPVIVDCVADTITLDPNWVAPSAGGGAVTYYVNTDDEYIHHTAQGAYNSSESDRVTKNELVANLESNTVIMLGNTGLFSGAIESRSKCIPNAFDWSMNSYVTATVRYDGEPVHYHTAEYTPGPR